MKRPLWLDVIILSLPTFALMGLVLLLLPIAKTVAILLLCVLFVANLTMSLWAPKVLRWVDTWR